MVSEGEAFCPGHVTAFFEVHEDPDPRKKGSRGAGLCLSLGVRTVARVRDDARPAIDIIVNGRRQKAEVTQRVAQKVLGGRSCEVKILCETTLPVSQGFGGALVDEFSRDPTLERLFELGARFAERSGLADKRVLEVIRASRMFGRAMMAMLGNSVVATGSREQLATLYLKFGTLQRCGIDNQGARVL